MKEKIISKSKNSDNYDIEDHGSDDSTDDDQAPKKKIPKWAMGEYFFLVLDMIKYAINLDWK